MKVSLSVGQFLVFLRNCSQDFSEILHESCHPSCQGIENNIVIISDSIANFNINAKAKINNSIRSGRVRFRNFPVATSEELLHYMDPTLAEGNYNTAISPRWYK